MSLLPPARPHLLIATALMAGFCAPLFGQSETTQIVGDAQEAFRLTERELIPEGIAYDVERKRFFVSSVYLAKIVQIDENGDVSDFIGSREHGFYGGVGIEVDRKRGLLWAAGAMGYQTKGFVPEGDGLSGLFAFDLEDGSLRHRFLLPNTEQKHLLNDLAIDADGAVYVTDTLASTVFRVGPDLESFERLPISAALPFPNGIALSREQPLLYIATDEGLRVLRPSDGVVSAVTVAGSIATIGIDGLYWYQGSLVAVQNHRGFNRVVRFFLSEGDPTRIESLRILAEGHPAMDIPTTGTFVGRSFVFIANSGLDRFDESGQLYPVDRLEEPIVLEVGLDDGE